MRRLLYTLLVAATFLFAGCAGGDDDSHPPKPTATRTSAATATSTAAVESTATTTPLPTETSTSIISISTPTATSTASPSETASPTPTATATAPRVIAKQITDESELIGGALAVGRVGDYLIANDRIRAVIKQPGRDLSFLLTYGGNIVDADVVRAPGEPGRDNFGAMTPLINVSSTVNVTEITVINDGSDGEPAVIHTVGVDDLLDAIDPGNAIAFLGGGIVGLPPSAVDNDIPVRVMTEYSLALGDDAIRIETTVLNEGDEPLTIYIGDYVNSSGEVQDFVPSFGFGDVIYRPLVPYLAFPGVGSAVGVTYGIVPIALPDTPLVASGFGQSGFFAYLLGQNLLEVLLLGSPGVFDIPPHETTSFVRHFVVTDGDVGSIATARDRILDLPVGEIGGRITVAGQPVAGAPVSVVQKPGELEAPFNVVDSFRTDDQGSFGGTLAPGDYLVVAKVPGHAYDSGTSTPTEHPVTVIEGQSASVDIDFPAAGSLEVVVSDPSGAPLPAKVSLVGFDPAPDPRNVTSLAIVSINGFVFDSDVEQKGAELFGLTEVYFVGPSGTTGALSVPPGEYEVVVSRGGEYSIHSERVTIAAGAPTTVEARLVRVVDTPGFVSGDHHVHLINSLDSHVTRDLRILTMAAEGIEYFVASDHDFLTDLRADVERLGIGDFVATDVSSEITTFNFGHFNAWPLEPEPDRVGGGPIDWGRAGVAPGMDYPSLGSYDLSPAELFDAARDRLRPGRDAGVVQVNHFNDPMLGFFHLTGIDTALVPPQSAVDPSAIRQNPALENMYDDNYSALELWIEGNRVQTVALLDENLGDWFNLLNQGRIKSGTADSDSHQTAIIQAGGPRTYLASSTDEPAEIDPDELAASTNGGRVIGTNAPFVRFELEGDAGAVAGLGLGQPKLVAATGGTVTIRLNIQSADWAEFDTINVYSNTVPVPLDDQAPHGITVPSYRADPTLVRNAGTDFEVHRVPVESNGVEATRLEADVEIPFPVERDAWIVVLVMGTDGISRPLWPMNPQDLDRERNQTLDDLTDGNLGEGGNTALAFTNPLFADVDGNGRFDPIMIEP